MSDSDKTRAEQIDPEEVVDQDDPRYDGFRIKEMWIATAVAPDNMEAMLFVDPRDAVLFQISRGPAFAADERRLVRMRRFAQAKATEAECEVRIRHLVFDGEDEVIKP